MNYYQILGVSRNATHDEIKHAFWDIARNLHPDYQKTDAERSAAHERMVTVYGPAYEVLSDEKKRHLYDSTLPPEEVTKETVPKTPNPNTPPPTINETRTSRPFSGEEYTAFYNDMAKKYGWREESILIPESDWALLAGLVQAYACGKETGFVISKTPNDERDWMPKDFYIIQNEPEVVMNGKLKLKGRVVVARTVVDWLDENKRNEDVLISYDRDVRTQTRDAKGWLTDDFLRHPGLRVGDQTSSDISAYCKYIDELKRLAKKIAGKDEAHKGDLLGDYISIAAINRYGGRPIQDVRVEGIDALSGDPNREWIRPIKAEELLTRLKEAERCVRQVENIQGNAEGALMLPSGTPGGEKGK